MPVIPFLTDVLESVPITIHIAPKVVVIFHCRQTIFSSVAVVGLVGAPRGKCQGCGGGFPHPRILNGPVCSTEPKTVFEFRVCKTTRYLLYIILDGIIVSLLATSQKRDKTSITAKHFVVNFAFRSQITALTKDCEYLNYYEKTKKRKNKKMHFF